MDLRDLAYFERIADLGHLGRAADELGRTKPALTKCVRRLEQRTGLVLFERRGRHIALTPGGELLRRKARQLRIAMDETVDELAGFSRGETGHLRIGVGPSVGQYLLPGILAKLHKRAAQITSEIVVDIGERNRERLADNQLDLMLTTVSPLDAEAFMVYRLVKDAVVVVASASNPLCKAQNQLADLVGRYWVLPSTQAETRQWIDRVFLSRDLPPPKVAFESNSIDLSKKIIGSGEFLGFVPNSNLADGEGAELLAVPVPGVAMKRSIGILARKSSSQNACIDLFLSIAAVPI